MIICYATQNWGQSFDNANDDNAVGPWPLSRDQEPTTFSLPHAVLQLNAYNLPQTTYYGFQTVCKCPFWELLVTSATDSNQTWAN